MTDRQRQRMIEILAWLMLTGIVLAIIYTGQSL